MTKCFINGCIACRLANSCPLKEACEENRAEKTPFSKQLCCLLEYSAALVHDIYKYETTLPKFTYAETMNNWLWIIQGAITQLANNIFDMDEANQDFDCFETARQHLRQTVEMAGATFLKKPLALLSFCATEHDTKVLNENRFTTPR